MAARPTEPSFAAGTSDVVILGGCGRVGLPLAIAFADRGVRATAYDIDANVVDTVNNGALPFAEENAGAPLRRAVDAGMLRATTDPASVGAADVVIVVIGTPVDEHLNPDPGVVVRALDACAAFLRDGQLIVLRSTVYPGVTALVERHLRSLGITVDVAFCPERISEGHAMDELFRLPQIVGSRTESAATRAGELFSVLTPTLLHVSPEEAELAKLFTNSWRYLRFAIANQFYVMANDKGLDYERIRSVVAHDYPRAADLPGAGLAAGPCLFKDTMQLAAFADNAFVLGHAAMLVNEGMPLYIVSRLERRFELESTTVGILGMAFKAGSDDTRESLAYKLRRILRFRAGEVLCTDEYVTSDPTLLPLSEVVGRADVLVIAAPHDAYATLLTDSPVIDIWGCRGGSVIT